MNSAVIEGTKQYASILENKLEVYFIYILNESITTLQEEKKTTRLISEIILFLKLFK